MWRAAPNKTNGLREQDLIDKKANVRQHKRRHGFNPVDSCTGPYLSVYAGTRRGGNKNEYTCPSATERCVTSQAERIALPGSMLPGQDLYQGKICKGDVTVVVNVSMWQPDTWLHVCRCVLNYGLLPPVGWLGSEVYIYAMDATPIDMHPPWMCSCDLRLT